MIGEVLAWSGFYGGAIGELLSKWEGLGVFSYMLPFLIIFALIFGILNQMRLFKDSRAVNSILALAVSLMSLQFEFVPRFFSEVFPRLGVGIAIILVVLILVGLFMDPSKGGIMITLLGIGLVIAVVVLVNTSNALGWNSSFWIEDHWDIVITILIVALAVGLVIGLTGKRKKGDPYKAYMFRTGDDD
ncbi:MAG: hypothetical protein ABIH59_00490 [archaeon]